jgi:hypothetical protein
VKSLWIVIAVGGETSVQAPGPQLPADQHNQLGLSMAGANGNNSSTSSHRFSSLFGRRTSHIDLVHPLQRNLHLTPMQELS